MKKILFSLFSFVIIFNTANAQIFSVTKCYGGPTVNVGNTAGTAIGSVNFVSGVDIPAGQMVVDVVVEIVWSKTDDGSCVGISGIASDLSHVGFRVSGPAGSNGFLAPSAATGPFATPATGASFVGTFPGFSQGVVRDTIVFKDGYSSMLPAGLPNFPLRDTVAPYNSLSFYNNTSPYGSWSIAAIDDAPFGGPKLCIHSYCITIRTCNYNTTAPVPNSATLSDINAMCPVTALTTPTATDECDYTVSHDLVLPFSTPGTTVINWTYTDVWGNVSTQTQNLNYAAISDKTVAASPTEICTSGSSTITVSSSQIGVIYTLRDNSNNSIVAGPTVGTGSAINFNTGLLTSTKTYNVLGAKSTLASVNALNFTGNTGLKKVSLGTSIWTDNFAGTNKLTVEAWVNRSSTGSLHSIIGNYQGSYPFLFRIDGDKATLFVNSGTSATGATSIPVGTWTHLAATYDGTTIKIYVNGVLDGSVAYSGNFISTTSEVKIGGGLSNNTEFFPGDIADVRLWNVAKTQSEIAASKNIVLSGNEPGLIANYKFNEGSGTTTANLRNGNAYPGTLVNSPAWVTGPTLSISDPMCTLQMTNTPTVTVTAVPSLSTTQTNVSCLGDNNGIIDLTASGGTGPYTYQWSNGATTEDISNLGGGVYTCTVTTASSCTATTSAIVSEPSALTATASVVNNVSCNGLTDGSATATVTGGTVAYSYAWSNGATSATITNLGPGVYTYTVTDAKNCSATASTTISGPTILLATASVVNNVSCNGLTDGSATATVTGGTVAYSYTWSNGQITTTAVNLFAGVYTYTVTDANGCTATASATITEPTAITANSTVDNNVLCNGGGTGSATADVIGGTGAYTYVWSNGQITTTAVNLFAGVYTYTVTDANGCTATASATITEPTAITANSTVDNNVLCNGGGTGSATADVIGGTGAYTYVWSNGQITTTAVNLFAGVYTYTVTDANGCTATASSTISEPTAITANSTVDNNVLCNGGGTGSATADVSGGTGAYTYVWSNGQITTTAVNLFAGVYTYTVTDANGCTATTSATITEPTAITANSTVDNNISCNGLTDGSATANVTGGTGTYSYAWSNGAVSSSIINLGAGVYTYTVTDANGCATTASATISEPAAIDATTTLTAETITANESSATYQWVDCDNANTPITNETNQSYTAIANGNYAVVVTVGACNEMSACVNIASVGLRDITTINYTVNPNPSTGLFTVNVNTTEVITLKVYDMIGKLIVSQTTANNTSVINLSNYENGVYSLTIETANKKSTSRIVLTK